MFYATQAMFQPLGAWSPSTPVPVQSAVDACSGPQDGGIFKYTESPDGFSFFVTCNSLKFCKGGAEQETTCTPAPTSTVGWKNPPVAINMTKPLQYKMPAEFLPDEGVTRPQYIQDCVDQCDKKGMDCDAVNMTCSPRAAPYKPDGSPPDGSVPIAKSYTAYYVGAAAAIAAVVAVGVVSRRKSARAKR